jgi:hypothetical protein
MTRRLRQVIDLYVSGTVTKLRDGTPVWMQALNPFEYDTARNEAQIAKARLTLALKEFGSDEQAKVRMMFFDDGIDGARRQIIDARVAEKMPQILERIQSDPDFKEKFEVLQRGLDDTARIIEPIEQELLTQLATEYTTMLNARLEDERSFQTSRYEDATEEVLWEDYLDWYLSRRAGEVMIAEFKLHQVLFGARWCDADWDSEAGWDHSGCNGHQERLFVDKEAVRTTPDDLLTLLMDAAEDVEMSVREAKNAHRQGSSSDSSPLPSEAGESTASTPDEIPVAPHGS